MAWCIHGTYRTNRGSRLFSSYSRMINVREVWMRYENNGFNKEGPDQEDQGSTEAMNNQGLCSGKSEIKFIGKLFNRAGKSLHERLGKFPPAKRAFISSSMPISLAHFSIYCTSSLEPWTAIIPCASRICRSEGMRWFQ